MFKNVAGQKFRVFAFDITTNLPKTGDAANITVYVSKDFGTPTATTDTSATEESSTNAAGYYLVDASQAETNADNINVTAKSSTTNIVVIGAPANVPIQPANFTTLGINDTGGLTSDILASGTATAGTSTSLTLQTALGSDNCCKGMTVDLIGGTGAGQSRPIGGYIDSSKVLTPVGPWTITPNNTTVYRIRYGFVASESFLYATGGNPINLRQGVVGLLTPLGPNTGVGGTPVTMTVPTIAAAGTPGWSFTFNLTTGQKTGATFTPPA